MGGPPYKCPQEVVPWETPYSGPRRRRGNNALRFPSQKMLIGQGGHMIARIAREASEDLMDVFQRVVKLKLSVKMEKVKK